MAAMGQTESPLTVYPSKGKLVGLISLYGFFAGLGGWVLHQQVDTNAGVLAYLASSLGLVLFCALSCAGLYRLLVPIPAVVVDERGIVDNASGMVFGAGLIQWREIAEIVVYQHWYAFGVQRFLCIVPRDSASVQRRQNIVMRFIMTMGAWLTPAPINISQLLLPIRADELAREIARRHKIRVRHVKP